MFYILRAHPKTTGVSFARAVPSPSFEAILARLLKLFREFPIPLSGGVEEGAHGRAGLLCRILLGLVRGYTAGLGGVLKVRIGEAEDGHGGRVKVTTRTQLTSQ